MTIKIKHRCNDILQINSALKEGFTAVEVDLVWGVSPRGSNLIHTGHDHGAPVATLSSILRYEYGSVLPFFAFNVKEYGMAIQLKAILEYYGVHEYFIFDVPGPELPEYRKSGLTYFGRLSYDETQRSSFGTVVDLDQENRPEKTPLPSVREMLTSISSGTIVALISNTLRDAEEWGSDIIEMADYLITK